MAKDLLLEIGMEEIPSRFIRSAMQQLADKTVKWLQDSRIGYAHVETFASPRRITVRVGQVEEKQSDVSEEAKGPSRKIAKDEQGSWTKAALGFAKSQGVEPEKLYFKEVAGVEYVHALKESAGVATSELLSEGLTTVVQSMSFPKNMRWGSYEMKFVRPIRWIAALFGSDVIPMTLTGVTSGRITRGHRFLGSETVLEQPSEYVEKLKAQYVFVDLEERERIIRSQIQALADEKGWTIPVKEDLLEEVLFLVEFPTVLFGTFNPEFLRIPQEVLITSMREHQRYFPVLDAEGNLLPFFVTVRNGNSTSLEQVARGNEKVLRARLSDAKFFYEEDQKQPIDAALARLETVVFHEELGTVGDKVRRIVQTADRLSEKLTLSAEERGDISRAAAICKFDLVTNMVYEFPELQGVMGEDYARKAGEREAVARAVFQHYQPRFSGESSPASVIGAVVSIADKLDTIVGCFSIGIVPTGSQDPYALRRQAAGIVQIMLDHSLDLNLSTVFELALDVHEGAHALKRSRSEIVKDLYDFFLLRVKNVLNDRQIRYDIVDAVASAGIDDVNGVVRRAEALKNAVQEPDFKPAVDAFNRVANLAAKAEGMTNVNPDRFEHDAEHALYKAWQTAHNEAEAHLRAGHESEALTAWTGLKDPVNAFFDAVMVMAEDEGVRANRLALLSIILADVRRLADFSKLVWA